MNFLEPNSIISHYRILSRIGAGGMGEVYLAQDTSELERNVALKILPAEVAKDKDRLQRFTQEARAVSNLNHPNILTVHEFGQTESISFIATEFVDGITLRQHLEHRRLKLVDVLDVAIQIVAALNAAHEAGITHRDLKPENVMIRKDHIVKVLDFGLAKLTTDGRGEVGTGRIGDESNTLIAPSPRHPISPSPLTNPGVVMGTVSYMSPEQSIGKGVDHRTDIWSLGAVIYEMLSGELPFQGKDIHRQIIAIQEQEPVPLSQLVDNVPDRLEEITAKCLAKEKEERYQTAKDLLIDLRNLRRRLDVDAEIERTVAPEFRKTSSQQPQSTQLPSPASEPPTVSTSSAEYIVSGIRRHKLAAGIVTALILIGATVAFGFYLRKDNSTAFESIAILPFENRSGATDAEYLSDGLAESLIFRLTQLPNLKVSPRSSAFRYKGKDIDVEKVGSELGVDTVMSGRLTQHGDNLTISVELVDVKNRKSLWGEQYERKMSDLLVTQREIASTIAQKLQLKLTGQETGLTKRYTDNNEAYQLYLRGEYHVEKRSRLDLDKSIEAFKQAIILDPNFAMAYVGIADAYILMPSYAYLSGRDAMSQAKAAAQRAMELDPNLAEAHSSYAAAIGVLDLNWVEAERRHKRALELNPNGSGIHYAYALNYLMPQRRLAEAIAEVNRALELEPMSVPMGSNLAAIYLYSGQKELGLEQAKKMVSLDPNHVTAKVWLIRSYVINERYAEALPIAESAIETDPNSQALNENLGYIYARMGRRQDAENVIAKLNELSKTQHIDRYVIASIYAALGDKDKAFPELKRSFDERDWGIVRINVDPLIASLRDDPRFKEVIRLARLPE